jgi:glyoxylase-like metal-dependent hydrolase (beta-lactamase superfamily II)
MILEQIPLGEGKNFAYIFGDQATREAAVIDPGFNPEKILKRVEQLKVYIKYIFKTHSHGDHTAGNGKVKDKTGAKIVAHFRSPSAKDISVKDQDTLHVGSINVTIIHTPGHTPDGMSALVSADGETEPRAVFTGDTLFAGSVGRSDFPGGNHTQLIDGIKGKLLILPEQTKVYPGHGPATTIRTEKRHNPFLNGND